jgi:uncharacterized membrane protein
MQTVDPLAVLGLIVLIGGILLIALGFYLKMRSGEQSVGGQSESKGVILIGPIPIIWGFGPKGKIVALVAVTGLILVWVLLYYW